MLRKVVVALAPKKIAQKTHTMKIKVNTIVVAKKKKTGESNGKVTDAKQRQDVVYGCFGDGKV